MKKYEVRGLGSVGWISALDTHPYDMPKEALSDVNGLFSYSTSMIGRNASAKFELWDIFDALGTNGMSKELITELDYMTNSNGRCIISYGTNIAVFHPLGFTVSGYDDDTAGAPGNAAEHAFLSVGSPYPGHQPVVASKLHGCPVAVRGENVHDPRPKAMISEAGVPDVEDMVFRSFPGFSPGDPANEQWYGCSARVVAVYDGIVILANYTDEFSQHRPGGIWWCNPVDPGYFPTEDQWDYTDPAQLAGRVDLTTTVGEILAIKKLGDDMMIYGRKGIYRMTFTGDEFVFRFTAVTSSHSLAGYRCVIEVDSTHIIRTTSDVVLTDGHRFSSIADGKVKVWLRNNTPEHYINTACLDHVESESAIYLNAGINKAADVTVRVPSVILRYDLTNGNWSKDDYGHKHIQDSDYGLDGNPVCSKYFFETDHDRRTLYSDSPVANAQYVNYLFRDLPVFQSIEGGPDADYIRDHAFCDPDPTGLCQITPPAEDIIANNLQKISAAENLTYKPIRLAKKWIPALPGGLNYPHEDMFKTEVAGLMFLADHGGVPPLNSDIRNDPSPAAFCRIERTDINLGDDESVQIALWVYLRIKDRYGDSVPRVSIGATETHDEDVTWHECHLYDISAGAYRVPARVTGRRHAIRIDWFADDPNQSSIEGYDILFEEAGTR